MTVEPLALPGLLRLQARVWPDARGYVYEGWSDERYAEIGVGGFVQDNVSHSRRGVVRGLHWQVGKPQGKLVTVIAGEILDVVVDLRRRSPTFGRHVAVPLSEGTGVQLWVPVGFAHGFVVRSASATVLYKCTDHYLASGARGVRWDDPALAIAWDEAAPVLSDADRAWPVLAELASADLFDSEGLVG